MLNPWTLARIETLKTLWAAGSSAALISVEMGVSRSAVLGKVKRLGLPDRALVQRKKYCRKSAAPKKAGKTKFALSFNNAIVTKIPVAEFEERRAAVEPLHLDLLQLTASTCRFPYGHGPFTFCGCDIQPDKPYCPAHVELTTDRTQRQRDGQRKKIPGSLSSVGAGRPRMFA